jgi:hypothetical protein
MDVSIFVVGRMQFGGKSLVGVERGVLVFCIGHYRGCSLADPRPEWGFHAKTLRRKEELTWRLSVFA